MKKLLLTIITIVVIISCGTAIKPIALMQQPYESVPLKQELIKEIGETLIAKGAQYYQEALEITDNPGFKINGFEYPYGVATVFQLAGQNKNFWLYYNQDITPENNFGLAKDKSSGEIKPYLFNAMGFFPKSVDGFKTKEVTYTGSDCAGCLKQEFIFTGKANNTLNFLYREYINDLARPAFTQNLQYDLAEGNIVGFNGLRIEVIKATNIKITYRVLSSFK